MQPPKLLLALGLAATGLAHGIHQPHQQHAQEPDIHPRDDAKNDMVQMVHEVEVPLLQPEPDCLYCATVTIPLDMADFLTDNLAPTAGLEAGDITKTVAATAHVFTPGSKIAELEIPGGLAPGFHRTTTRQMKHHPLHDITFEYTIKNTDPATEFVMTISDEKHGTSTISAEVSTVNGGTREVLIERYAKVGSDGFSTTVTATPDWKPAKTAVDNHVHTSKATPRHVQMNFPTDKRAGETWTTTVPADDAMVTATITVMNTAPTHYLMTFHDGDYTEVVEAQVSRGARHHHVSLEETMTLNGLTSKHVVTWPNPKPKKTKGAIVRRAIRTMVVTVLDQKPGYTTLNSPTNIDSDVETSFITVTETKQLGAPLTPDSEVDVTTVSVETTVTQETTIQGEPTTVTTTQATTLTVAAVRKSTTSSSSSSQTTETSETSSEPTSTAAAEPTSTSSSDDMPSIFTRFNVPIGASSDESSASSSTTEPSSTTEAPLPTTEAPLPTTATPLPTIFPMPCDAQQVMTWLINGDVATSGVTVADLKEEHPDLDWNEVEFIANVFRNINGTLDEPTAQSAAVHCIESRDDDEDDSEDDSATCACPAPGLANFGTAPTTTTEFDTDLASEMPLWTPPALAVRLQQLSDADTTPPSTTGSDITSSPTVTGHVTGMLVVDAVAPSSSNIPTDEELWRPACRGHRWHKSKEQKSECALQRCMWNYIKPINYTTIFPAMMFDPYRATPMMDFVTQYTALVDHVHWGTSENSIYYPMTVFENTTTRERMDIAARTLFVETLTTTTAIRQTPTELAKKTGVAKDPKCYDEKSCYDYCIADYEEHKHGMKFWLLTVALPIGLLMLVALCCCGGLLHRKRRKQPVDEKNPNAVQVVTTQAVDTPAAAGAAAAAAARGGGNPAGAGTMGRQAEEGRSRVHFPEEGAGGAGQTVTPAGQAAAAPVEKVVQVPVTTAEKAAGAEHVEHVPGHDGADGHRTGSEMMDMGSLRGRKKNRME
ncbi:unnamed protein product [Zymoseptoria tritici ST99CH_3D7]|uniref:Uncharacterized protein n=1 Tax=Zymoseptoria tritici (strain ST99CH_3D7) TaxID=1276538 RepID=A0A1X7RGU4_ZYMT9|nr:unnamed protein product [Zymoseptoria tritici ST99CH_3D7]